MSLRDRLRTPEEVAEYVHFEVEKDDPDFVYGEALDNAYMNLGNAVRSLAVRSHRKFRHGGGAMTPRVSPAF
ncbi:MAG: hypothetical protein H0U59_00090 [Gemmatimonadaceae bacterium]|nr:hypothetical protein [Gemmatimonadaceae bacterium]